MAKFNSFEALAIANEKYADNKSLRCCIRGYNNALTSIFDKGNTSHYQLSFAVKLLQRIKDLESKLGL